MAAATRTFLIAALLVPACVLPALAGTTTGGYSITTIAAPNASSTSPAAINSAGQIVGSFQDTLGSHGFLYQSGVFSTIDCPNGPATNPLAISDSGIVYGSCESNIFQYVISTGEMTTFPIQFPAGYSNPSVSFITTISPTGEVFGWLSTTSGDQAFEYLYPNGPATFILGLPASTQYFPQIIAANSAGELVASARTSLLYLDGEYSLIPQLTAITGLGPSGQLLGVIVGAGNQAGAIYQNGLITLLQLPSTIGLKPTPVAMNTSGSVVGTYYQAPNYLFEGFLATPVTTPSAEKSAIHIDSPTPTSGALFGTYQLSGWAINNASGVDDVNIQVDGAWVGTTTTTLARPDVCAAFPNQSGCPTVGWQYLLDTAQLADGTHTLEAVAISNTGQRTTTTTSITVANAGQRASSVKLTIDTPMPQSPVSGSLTISGWAEDPGSYIAYVDVSIDVPLNSSSASFGYQNYVPISISRPDVCAAFPGDLHCPSVGWTYTQNISYLTNGPHTVIVVAYAENGDRTVATQTFTVANSGALKLQVDQPAANPGTLSGRTTISGWAFDPNARISTVSAVVDGLTNANMYFGGYRPDVCSAMPGGVDCPDVGWSGLLDTTQFANGTHTLSITATAQNSDSFKSQPTSFVVNNPSTGNTTHLFIDTPSAANQQFWGEAAFSGWALDDATPLLRLDFLIDGNLIANDGYFTPRPDVCAALPNRPNCPNVGWSYSFNTLALSNGAHTLTVRAVSETNSQATASVTFSVDNELGPNGTRLHIDSPAAGAAPVSGQTTVSGWALNAYGYISSLTASIDAGPETAPTYALKRPDVCQAYPDTPNCPNVGWSFGLDTTQLADGVHRLNVTAAPQDDYIGSLLGATQSVFFTVANSGFSSPIASYIDTPTASTPTLSGVTSFSGWAIDQTTTIANVSITIDSVPFGVATYGGSRPDVCAGFSQYAGCPAGAIGWSFAIDTTSLVNGSHTLAVTSASSDGRYHTITSSFSTAN